MHVFTIICVHSPPFTEHFKNMICVTITKQMFSVQVIYTNLNKKYNYLWGLHLLLLEKNSTIKGVTQP